MSQIQDPNSVMYDMPPEGSLSSDEETLKLWGHFQNALHELGQDRSKIGFLDVVVFGAQSSGKSSLLSTLSGLQLPTGDSDAVTKCPIRISVTDTNASFVVLPGSGKDQILLPYFDNKPSLTEKIYNQALQQLSQGQMTPKELEVQVGRPGQIPLTIVDTPGIIIDEANPVKLLVDQLVRTVLAGSGNAERPLLPIMTAVGTDVDMNKLYTSLVRGRSFITVFTHADHLAKDKSKVKAFRHRAKELQNLGCLACFMVSVRDSIDWSEEMYQEFCTFHSESSQEYETLLSMCGIPRLLKELQRRQLDHMLSQRHQLLSNLGNLASTLDVKNYPADEQAVSDGLRDVLSLIASDLQKVHCEGRSSLMDNGHARPIPFDYQANSQAAEELRKFTDDAFRDAMQNVMSGWTENDTHILGNNTLMTNMLTHAWNKTIQGLSLLTDHAGHATKACGELIRVLRDFILWRAKIHFQSKHLSMRHFEGFLKKYCDDKEATLMNDFSVISRELFYTQPSMQASQIYLFFESQPKDVAALLGTGGDLVKALNHPSGQWNLPVALPVHNKEFRKELDVAQRRIKLYAFFAVSSLVETLSRRMTYIIFAKTYNVMHEEPTSWTNAPLTSLHLEAAFEHHFNRKFTMEDWTDPRQAENKGKHEVVEKLIDALKNYRSSETGGKAPVYTHAKARDQLASIAPIPSPVNTGESPEAQGAASIPQDDVPRAPVTPEQAQPLPQTHLNANAQYNQAPEQNYAQPNSGFKPYNQGGENNAQAADYGQGFRRDAHGFNQPQQGYSPAYAQGQANYENFNNARTPHAGAPDANEGARREKGGKNFVKHLFRPAQPGSG